MTEAGGVRTIRLNQTMVGRINVSPGRSTILSFPTKPTKVILGNQGLFGIEYIESDLAVAALSSHSQSDIFVYLEGRRFAFDLVTVPSGSDTIVLVRDLSEVPEEQVSAPHPKKSTKKKESHERRN